MARRTTSINVKLEAESTRLIRELEKANNKLNKWEKQTKSSIQKVENSFKALGAILGTGLFANMIKNTIDAGDQIQKLSIRLNASTEALSEYKHVAETTGVSFQTLTTAWQRQTRRIAEATQGTGEAKKALEELGLSAQALNSLRPEQQFEVLADAMSQVDNQADKVRLAMRLWDTEGVALLQTIDQGAAGLQRYRAEARKAGATITQEMADKMADAKSAFQNLSTSGNALANTLAIQLVPMIQWTADWLNQALPTAIQSSIKYFALFGKAINEGIQVLGEFMETRARLDREFAETIPGRVGGALGLVPHPEEIKKTEQFWKDVNASAELASIYWDTVSKDADAALQKLNEPLKPAEGSKLALLSGKEGIKLDKTAEVKVEFDQDIGAENFEKRLEYLQEHQRQVEAITKEHGMRLYKENKDINEKIAQTEKLGQQSRLSSTASILGSLSALVAGESKKSFENSKKLAYAETIVSTYAAAQLAFAQGMKISIPTAFGAAAAAIVAGLARAKAISDTTYGGGGGVAAAATGAVPVAPVSAATGFPAQQQQTTINLVLDDQVLGKVVVDGVVNGINNDEIILRDETTFNRVGVV